MKFRTDFVTNSSSSCFIFQRKYSDEDVHRLRSRLMEKSRNALYSPDYRELNDDFDKIIDTIKTIDNFTPDVLDEVIGSYYDELLPKLIGDCDLSEDNIHTLPDEKYRVLVALWYLIHLPNPYHFYRDLYRDPSKEYKPTDDLIKEYYSYPSKEYTPPTDDLLAKYFRNEMFDGFNSDCFVAMITDNAEKFLNTLFSVVKMSLPEIFEMVTGGKYLHYGDMETHHKLTSEVFREDNNCLFGCDLM